MTEFLIWGGVVVGGAGTLAGLWRVIRAFARVVRKLSHFADDWFGQEARPGVPERPGVMARLESIEDYVRSVQHEVVPNSGASLRDAVDRIESKTRSGE
ncbi:hypothetical protein [Amycolatopsis sp. CA-230715]|uniref:hypothetical protein n=1 Tax=Amycolatopsis sp. CA-230715 TaxID=2745196 RepID=UPI001C01F951|nr:hypothetical protein [Amycolatopsis sp. CA-230715]QWF81127.1 hypothetical protein HUW46_04553 [Amycolatopsis sp. CA-230715]